MVEPPRSGGDTFPPGKQPAKLILCGILFRKTYKDPSLIDIIIRAMPIRHQPHKIIIVPKIKRPSSRLPPPPPPRLYLSSVQRFQVFAFHPSMFKNSRSPEQIDKIFSQEAQQQKYIFCLFSKTGKSTIT